MPRRQERRANLLVLLGGEVPEGAHEGDHREALRSHPGPHHLLTPRLVPVQHRLERHGLAHSSIAHRSILEDEDDAFESLSAPDRPKRIE